MDVHFPPKPLDNLRSAFELIWRNLVGLHSIRFTELKGKRTQFWSYVADSQVLCGIYCIEPRRNITFMLSLYFSNFWKTSWCRCIRWGKASVAALEQILGVLNPMRACSYTEMLVRLGVCKYTHFHMYVNIGMYDSIYCLWI